MKWLAAIIALLAPVAASAHPHIWISQHVRMIVEGGKYTRVELEWRFDPMASENEIPAIDEDGDGKISMAEAKALADDTLPELQKVGFLTWLNTGGADFHPPQLPTFVARIDDPPSFSPPDWNHDEGDKDAGMPMPENKRVTQPEPHSPRNLVYVMRFALPQPVTSLTITAFEADDYIRVEVDKASLPAGCTFDKHPTYKSEFVPGKPVFADRVSCHLQ
jgi:Protein of unknown function (DUF1007)